MTSPQTLPKDRFGNEIRVGDKVKLLYIDTKLLEKLSSQDQDELKSMLNIPLSVNGIDEHGHPLVEKWFSENHCHSLAVLPAEIEKVTD